MNVLGFLRDYFDDEDKCVCEEVISIGFFSLIEELMVDFLIIFMFVKEIEEIFESLDVDVKGKWEIEMFDC